jgi:hypothetical protein
MSDQLPVLLTPADRISPTWQKLNQHLTKRLEALRLQNDADNTPEQTAKIRGQIQEVKFLLKLAQRDGKPLE